MVDRQISFLDVFGTAGNFYPTTMTAGGTNVLAGANSTAFAADVLAAATAGKDLIIKPGKYYVGDGTTRTIDLAGTVGCRIFASGVTFIVVSGGASQQPCFEVTTKNGWVEYDVSAFTWSTTSGGTPAMNTQGEVSSLTLASGPASWIRNEAVSIYSNDPTWYGRADGATGGDVELNWQHEMSKILSAATATTPYLTFKTERNFTPSGAPNICKLRRYNNFGIVFEIYGLTLDTDGDPYDGTTYVLAARPKQVFQIFGIESPIIDASVTIKRVWQGDFAIGYSIGAVYAANIRIAPNKQGTVTTAFLGYCPAWYGANLKPRVDPRTTSTMRHQTTIWSEAPVANISAAAVGATTTLTVAYDATSPTSTMQVGDTIHIEGIVGTLSSLNGTKQTITATNGTTSVTFAFNSTALTYTSGGIVKIMSVGRIYGPTAGAIHYGEVIGLVVDGGVSVASTGGIDDEHENAIGSIFRNRSFYGGAAWASEDTSNRAFNNRGAGSSYENYDVRGMAQAGQFHSFSQNHGVDNIIRCSNFTIRNESNRSGSAAIFDILNTNNANAPTDKRKLILDRGSIGGGFLTFLTMPSGGPDVQVSGWDFAGDWGTSGVPSKNIFEVSGGNLTVEDCTFDFSNVVSGATITRLLTQNTSASTVTFRRCTFKGIFAPSTTAQYMIVQTVTGCTLSFEDCYFLFDTGKTLQRFISPSASTTQVINFRSCEFRGMSTLDPARGLINIGNAAVVVTGVKDKVVADAAIAIAGTTIGAGSSYTPSTLSAI